MGEEVPCDSVMFRFGCSIDDATSIPLSARFDGWVFGAGCYGAIPDPIRADRDLRPTLPYLALLFLIVP